MATLNIVYYDPFDADEEAYIAQNYRDGQRADEVAKLYAAMREWRANPNRTIPFYEAADAAHYPDMAYACNRTGFTMFGLGIIRGYQREYRDNHTHPRCRTPGTQKGHTMTNTPAKLTGPIIISRVLGYDGELIAFEIVAASIAELEAEMKAMYQIDDARIAELEAQLAAAKAADMFNITNAYSLGRADEHAELAAAGQWIPMPDGIVFHEHERVYDEGFYTGYDESIWFLSVRRNGEILVTGSMPEEDEYQAFLPDDIRLCRRVTNEAQGGEDG